jgi:hypothetical protein
LLDAVIPGLSSMTSLFHRPDCDSCLLRGPPRRRSAGSWVLINLFAAGEPRRKACWNARRARLLA